MKRMLSLLLSCALGLPALAGCSAPPSAEPPGGDGSFPAPPSQPWSQIEKMTVTPKPSGTVNTALAAFGLELLKQTRSVNGEKAMNSETDHAPFSTLVSPLSVHMALSMAANGADGATLAQLRDVLGGGAELDELNAACAQYIFDCQGLRGSSRCRIANSLWEHLPDISEEFVTRCRSFYSAQVYRAELSDPRTVDDINGWVSDKTGGLIPGLLDQPPDPNTALVLVNALYLKNQWAQAFDPLCTHEMEFHRAGGFTGVTEYLQHFDAELSYISGDGVQGVVLPYDDGRLGFFALLPDDLSPETPGLGDWLNTLDGDGLSRLIDSREDAMFLRLALPKFEAEWKGDLSEALSGMGLEDAFDPAKADFSQMDSTPENYCIGQVIHAAKIQVNEKGAEAAAATAVIEEPTAPPPPEDGVTLILNRPFLYGIIDLQTNLPLFLGTYE